MRHACNQSSFFRNRRACNVYGVLHEMRKTGKTAKCVNARRLWTLEGQVRLCAQDCRSWVAIVWDEESRTTVEL